VPGLINAYKSAAALAMQLTPIVRKPVEIIYDVSFDYTVTNEVLKVFRKFNCQIVNQEMLLFCNYEVGVPRIHEPEWLRMIAEVKGVVSKKKSGSVS
jgi:putative IMPACT (imprinted ancient) family translation regulator